jgi:Na+/melibiose symporter-like transporter
MTVPTVYALMGFTSDWDVLYNDAFRNKIFLASLVIGLVSAILSILPFLFYDLTDEKHKKIIEDLKQRADDKDSAAEQVLLAEPANAAE